MKRPVGDRLGETWTRVDRYGGLIYRHGESFLRHATPRKVVNLLRANADRWRVRPVASGYPFEIILDLTNRCNLRCPLCVTGQCANDRPFGQMDFEGFRRVVDELAPYLFKVRLHSWGEPLTHPRFYEMLGYLRDKNVGTEVSSNFMLFRPQDAVRLIDSGLELLVVSIDGTTQEVYEKYRVGGNLEKVKANVRALVEAKRKRRARFPVLETQFLLMRHNLHQAGEMEALSRELGADRCRVFPVAVNVDNPEQREKWLPAEEAQSRYDFSTLEDRYYSLDKACRWLWQSAVINWDGTVSPCCVYEGSKSELGQNVFAEGFRSIWNGDPYVAARATFRKGSSGNPDAPPGFNICRYCRGRPRPLDPNQSGMY